MIEVTHARFIRALERAGATVRRGSRHDVVFLNGRRTTVPRHARAFRTGTLLAMLKQLELSVAALRALL